VHLERSREKIAELEKRSKVIESDVEMLLKHFDNLKEKILQYSIFENQFKLKESELNVSLHEERRTEISLAELKKELEFTIREISNCESLIKRKEESKRKLHELLGMMDWLSNKFSSLVELTERSVLLQLRNEFSTLFRKWFLVLVSEDSLDTQLDENFTPIIIHGDTELEYDFLSGGERTAVALAYRLALNQTINSFLSKIKTRGIIILDEPTDGFSDAQINKIRDILEELDTDQLIMVSHEQKVESFVDNILRIEKNGNVSSIAHPQEIQKAPEGDLLT